MIIAVIIIVIHETYFEIVLESVSRRLHAFYAILYVLKVVFETLLHSFQTEIVVRMVLQRECTKSGRALFMEYHLLKNRTRIHGCWVIVCKNMLNPDPKCTLFASFCFNCCGIF